jgi:hypothetical protein
MSSANDFLMEQARQRPDSTGAIGLRAIEEEQWRRSHARRAAVKDFVTGFFKKA